MHCGATLLTQSAAPRRAASRSRRGGRRERRLLRLTKIDTLSDRLLSSQLSAPPLYVGIITVPFWIAPRYRNAAPSAPKSGRIVYMNLSLEARNLAPNWATRTIDSASHDIPMLSHIAFSCETKSIHYLAVLLSRYCLFSKYDIL